MALRLVALFVAVLILAVGGTAAVASAQAPLPPESSESSDIPWWEQDDPDEPVEDQTPVDPGGTVVPDDPSLDEGGADADGGWLPAPDEGAGEEEGGLPEIPVPTTKTIAGKVAYVRKDGKAAIPRDAPKRVRQLIAAANQIVGKPYKWGGGHAKLVDKGYDCSGTVSYALIRSGLLRSPLVSGALARWGAGGKGKWVSVYANAGHVYLEVAGLRLDTSAVGDRNGGKGPRWRPVIGKRKGFKTRHPVGL